MDKEHILMFYETYPDELEARVDEIIEDSIKNDWNVEVWRNS